MEKLDLENVRVYSGTKDDAKDAIDLISEEVYLSDDADFRSYRKGYLEEVNYANGIAYPFRGGIELIGWFKYLIRAKDAKFKGEKKEKKLRPYNSISEFWNGTGCEEIGRDIITVRSKITKQESVLLYIGYSNDTVHLGGYLITLKALFENYEFYENYELYDNNYDGGEWLPFGVEE